MLLREAEYDFTAFYLPDRAIIGKEYQEKITL